MPEGHTVHRIARDHTKWLAGARVRATSPQGRFDAAARHINGRELINVDACGKHLFYEFDDASIVHVHLGLFGRFRVHRADVPPPRDAVRLRLGGAERTIDLSGPTICELTDRAALAPLFARLGPDPLRADAAPERAWAKISRSRAPIGALLLNQAVIAGLGNIYRAEILHILAIHPNRPGNAITHAEFRRIWSLAVQLLAVGVKYNRIITADPLALGKPYSRINREERLLIYQRPECPRCGADVYYWEVGSRTVYACDACQV